MLFTNSCALNFPTNVPVQKKLKFLTTALGFTLGIRSAKALNDDAREVGAFVEVKEWKKKVMRSPYFQTQFWKAVYTVTSKSLCSCRSACLSKKEGKVGCDKLNLAIQEIATEFSVEAEDIAFYIKHMSSEDKALVKARFGKRKLSVTQTFEDVVDELRPYTSRLVHKQFAYILKHNRDLEAEDLIQDLLTEAYGRSLACSTMNDREHFIGTLKQKIKQAASNMLEYYNADKRSNLVRDEEDYRRKVENLAASRNLAHLTLEEKMARFKNEVSNEYQMRLFSLNYHDSECDDEAALQITADSACFLEEAPSAFEMFSQSERLQKILNSIPDADLKRCVSILLGEYDEQFDRYIGGKTLPERQIVNRLMDYFQFDRKTFNAKVLETLKLGSLLDSEQRRQYRIS